MYRKLIFKMMILGLASKFCYAEDKVKAAFFLPVYADSENDLRKEFDNSHGAIPFKKISYGNLDFICVTPVRGGTAGIKDIVVYRRVNNDKSWSLILLRRTVSTTVEITFKDGLLQFNDRKGQTFVSMQLDAELIKNEKVQQ